MNWGRAGYVRESMSKFKKKQIHETCDLKRAVLLVREPSEAAGLATLPLWDQDHGNLQRKMCEIENNNI